MIDKEEFEKASFEENQKLIKEILRLATHNAFTKDDLLLLIKWQDETIEKMKYCLNCANKDCPEDEEPCRSCLNRSKWELDE